MSKHTAAETAVAKKTVQFLWADTVGCSSMDLGVHYPTDVLAGAIIGYGSAFLTYKLNQWINKKTMKETLYYRSD